MSFSNRDRGGENYCESYAGSLGPDDGAAWKYYLHFTELLELVGMKIVFSSSKRKPEEVRSIKKKGNLLGILAAMGTPNLPFLTELVFRNYHLGHRMNWSTANSWNRLHQLEKLSLEEDTIGVNGCLAISKLLQNERSMLINLSLRENAICDECVSILVGALQQNDVLEVLSLDRNAIGASGCVELMALLRNEKSRVKTLSLRECEIDDECASVLADALKGNSSLESLDLDGNCDITSAGWAHFLNLVCNSTSMENTYHSNHTLCNLGEDFASSHRSSKMRINVSSYVSFGGGGCRLLLPHLTSFRTDSQNIPARLAEVLEGINEANSNRQTSHVTGQQKVFCSHLSREFPLGELLDLDVKIMPHLIVCIRRIRHLRGLHRVIRNWNVPLLFGFPSPLQERVRVLEAENVSLLYEIERMQAENGELKRGGDNAMMGPK